MHLVEALVEVVQHGELVEGVLVQTLYIFDLQFCFLLSVRIRLVERKDLFLFGFKFAAQFGSFEDFLAKLLVISQRLHALETVRA